MTDEAVPMTREFVEQEMRKIFEEIWPEVGDPPAIQELARLATQALFDNAGAREETSSLNKGRVLGEPTHNFLPHERPDIWGNLCKTCRHTWHSDCHVGVYEMIEEANANNEAFRTDPHRGEPR